MLVLTRKVGERVLVGNSIVVTVVRIGPNAVRLGIEAPKDVDIIREELAEPFDDVELPIDGVTVPGGSGHAIQVDEREIADLGRRIPSIEEIGR